ncbi:MAG: DNA-3-methyladenine glycosylase [Cyclobacteriaceae bacterium]|nr:DNA-3-methyladenine glycosylase [Cyclobacteriaceae bacterium]
MAILSKDFYIREDVVQVSKELLGKRICTHIEGIYTSGIITETESYSGRNDKACHAHLQKKTKRNQIMYAEGGRAYVYLCYGIHHLFNIVSNVEGQADAVLVRAIAPEEGLEHMMQRRKMQKMAKNLCAGPGLLTQALGINMNHYGAELWGAQIWIEDTCKPLKESNIVKTTRIGVGYAGEDALLPWRFYIKESEWVSKK